MKANYHSHTPRCKHATGTEEEYIQAALEAGFEVLGFSDHAPWPYATGYVSGIRMSCAELPDYIGAVREARRRHEGEIRVLLGLEAEYYPRYADHLRRMRDAGISYFLLGQHAMDSEEDAPWTSDACIQNSDNALRYADTIAQALSTGLYAYVCHPDIYLRGRTGDNYDTACARAADVICQAAKEYGVPLEYNLLGLSRQRAGDPGIYPNQQFWRQCAKWQVPAILGVDAHDPRQLLNTGLWDDGLKALRDMGYQVMEELPGLK